MGRSKVGPLYRNRPVPLCKAGILSKMRREAPRGLDAESGQRRKKLYFTLIK